MMEENIDTPIYEVKHPLEQVKQTTSTNPRILLVCWPIVNKEAQLHNELIQDVHVHDAKEYQEAGRDRGAYYATDMAEAVKALTDCGSCGSNDDGGYHNDAVED
jgi:hypothetical protein